MRIPELDTTIAIALRPVEQAFTIDAATIARAGRAIGRVPAEAVRAVMVAEYRPVLAGMHGAELDDVEAIAPVDQVAGVTTPDLALIPSVKREALDRLAEGFVPVMRRIPLGKRADNYLMNSISL